MTSDDAQKYARETVEERTGDTARSRRAPLTLSDTICRLAQTATVTQQTASREEMSCPATVASSSAGLNESPSGRAEVKLSL